MEYATREWFGPQNHWCMVFGFGPQNPGAIPIGIRGKKWCHREACIEAKLSHEGCLVVRCFYLKLDHYAPRDKWFSKISKGIVGNV
jgi:hypothetical protein